jgi:hypothetical protein
VRSGGTGIKSMPYPPPFFPFRGSGALRRHPLNPTAGRGQLPAFVRSDNRDRSYSAREANMSKISLPCALGVSSHGSARERDPIPPLSQNRHDVSQIRSTAADPSQISNCQNIPRLQVVQSFLPPGP